jgi:predicted transglutaminase-like cysteine proteinase
MVLDYAKTRSDATVQREGDPDVFEVHKRRRLAEKGVSSPIYVHGVKAELLTSL